jgi:iron(III) transport system substrate-binding protein
VKGVVIAFAVTMLSGAAAAADQVNVYSYRQPFLVEPLFAAFTERTGVQVRVVHAEKGLVERLKREGANSPADVILTVDISRLSEAKEAGVTEALRSPVLDANIPAQYRDPDGHWFGLTTRARIIVASKARVPRGMVASYAELASPALTGRVCTRSGKHAYMVGLTASMIVHDGEAAAEQWLRGLKANRARRPQGNDRGQVKAISEGECDVALINHYYMGAMMEDAEQSAWADAVYVVFPDQGGRGTHVNLSGVALARGAPNRDNAVRLIEFLSSDRAQEIYAEVNHEYPVKSGVPHSALLRSFGEFEPDDVRLADVAARRRAASKLVDKVDYDG